MKKELLERVMQSINNSTIFKCVRRDNIVEVLANGMKMFVIYENGFISASDKLYSQQFYKLFDIVSKVRADLILIERAGN